MRTLCSIVAAAALVALGAPPAALAQPKTADALYKEGEKQYNLGNFEGAIESFKKAYELEDKPAYLYNIAQAYRQLGKCRDAVFFYKRFLSLKASDTVKPLKPELKAEIEGRIGELEACARDQDAIASRPPPDQTLRPDEDGDKTGTPPGQTGKQVAANNGEEDGGEEDGGVTAGTEIMQPRIIAARLEAGAAKVGAGSLEVPIQVSVALAGGYPLRVAPKATVELGAGFTFTPVPYDKGGGETGNARLISLLANVGFTYAITPKIGIHADVGGGVMWFSGLEMGNPFTVGGVATTGALPMFNLRVGAAVEYAVTRNILIVGAPIAFAYSPAADGLIDDISALTRLDFMLGLGYRM